MIGSVSFGVSRHFHLKNKDLRTKILLTHGSFLLMKGATQHHWYHSIPKELKVTGSRGSILLSGRLSEFFRYFRLYMNTIVQKKKDGFEGRKLISLPDIIHKEQCACYTDLYHAYRGTSLKLPIITGNAGKAVRIISSSIA